ncbi:tetratricopeptide repeat protein [Vreelandella jeotgali]|uniref:tetratricopeptide repeat protein n=1 Tax=Vreelandella jeotgali TaxID=553386 RepID=UPI000688A0F7|nr:tetratricopeptide repeat protein [Halomonas jeotgali]
MELDTVLRALLCVSPVIAGVVLVIYARSLTGVNGFDDLSQSDTKHRAEQGDAQAQNNFGAMYLNGRGVFPRNTTKAAEWFRQAAEQGLASAQHNLGVMYLKGEGVPQDDTQAAEWTRQAAEQGIIEAQFGLGLLYGEGRGVPQNYTQAIKWFFRAQRNRALQKLKKILT